MIRKADPSDAIAIAAFLERHIETSMFLLGNLEAHGIGNTEHPHGTAYFLRETGDGLTGVFGCTNGGYLMCQLPNLGVTEAQTYAHLLQGYSFRGMTGDVDQTALILNALPVPADAWSLDRLDPLYRLDMAGIVSAEVLRAPGADDAALLRAWFAQYAVDAGLSDASEADAAGQAQARAALANGQCRLLIEDGQPVAMASVNARAGQTVQVGAVYVPPDLRGGGRAGRVVRALLAGQAGRGARTAILFAASQSAARAYQRIGFARVGTMRVALVRDAVPLGSPA